MSQDTRYQPPQSTVADVKATDESELASRGARLGAALVDGLISGLVSWPLIIYTGFWEKAKTGNTDFLGQLQIVVLGFVAFIVLHGYLLNKSGQTIGKRLVGTRIVSAEDNAILPLWKILSLRQLPVVVVSQIPVVGPLVGLIDALFVFRNDRRCLHDLLAGTKVVNDSAPWSSSDAPQ